MQQHYDASGSTTRHQVGQRFMRLREPADRGDEPVFRDGRGDRELQLRRCVDGGVGDDLKYWTVFGSSECAGFRVRHDYGDFYTGPDKIRDREDDDYRAASADGHRRHSVVRPGFDHGC